MLFIGEQVGTRTVPALDIALDPLEGTTIAAKNSPNSLAVVTCSQMLEIEGRDLADQLTKLIEGW